MGAARGSRATHQNRTWLRVRWCRSPECDRLPAEHPDSIRVQQAAAGLYKSVKIRRRQEKRRQVLEHDAAITALTATAAPDRIDDETEGLPLVSSAKGAIESTKTPWR